MSDVTTCKTAQHALLSFQNQDNENEEDLRHKARSRDCFVDIGSTSTFLYPILESETFVPSSLTNTFANFTLFHCILDCYCDNTTITRELNLFDWICDQGVPFQSFVGRSYKEICQNKAYFLNMIRNVQVSNKFIIHI